MVRKLTRSKFRKARAKIREGMGKTAACRLVGMSTTTFSNIEKEKSENRQSKKASLTSKAIAKIPQTQTPVYTQGEYDELKRLKRENYVLKATLRTLLEV